MARPNRLRFLAVTLLALQLLGVGVWLPTHADADNLPGTGHAKITEHRDNGPCRDVPLSSSDYCAICAASQNRVAFEPVHIEFSTQNVVARFNLIRTTLPRQQLLFDSFSRRGPPSLLF
jgi:hypothetical protein